MVACAPDDSQSRDRIMQHQQQQQQQEEEDPSTMVAMDNDTAPIDLNQDNGWPTAEGYTPLGDMFHLGSVLVAMPPDDEGDDEDGQYYAPTSFVADPTALFGNVNATNHDNVYGNNEDDDDGEAEPNNPRYHDSDDASDAAIATNSADEFFRFRNMARGALMALENDYEMTQRGEVRPSLMDSQPSSALVGPSMSLFDAASFSRNNDSSFDTNFADFESINYTATAATTTTSTTQKQLPKIDTAAVQKAVAGITNNTSLEAKLQKWQTEQHRTTTSKHSLIPSAPLKAFSKNTPKAIAATANLTRSATIAECLHRLSNLLTCQDLLTIHLVGTDHVECESAQRVQSVLAPLVRWIGANLYSPKHLKVALIGPNVPSHMSSDVSINLLASHQQQQQATTTERQQQRLVTATALCQEASYHDWLDVTTSLPDLVVCFNAGIWGYDEWKPTIRALVSCDQRKIPFVVTSYTLEEAEDDYDVILETVAQEKGKEKEESDADAKQACIWGPETNYFGSKQKRVTATAVEGREYRENAAWQAWRL